MTDVSDRTQTKLEDLRSIETVIIGGGQSGLSVGYHLAKAGRPFVILDASEERATHGATGGTLCSCSPPRASTRCRACLSRRVETSS